MSSYSILTEYEILSVKSATSLELTLVLRLLPLIMILLNSLIFMQGIFLKLGKVVEKNAIDLLKKNQSCYELLSRLWIRMLYDKRLN